MYRFISERDISKSLSININVCNIIDDGDDKEWNIKDCYVSMSIMTVECFIYGK